jgi:hypothetical protein
MAHAFTGKGEIMHGKKPFDHALGVTPERRSDYATERPGNSMEIA